MSYFLRSPIRTNKGREATETEGLVIYIYICLFVCPELIEETTMPTGLNFGLQGYFGSGSDKFKS